MRVLFVCLFLASIIAVQGVAATPQSAQTNSAVKPTSPVGRWRVKFKLTGGSEKNLILEAAADGSSSFQLLDTGPDDKPVALPAHGAWSLTNNNLSVSGEAELPLGTCCRETGTVIFKAKFSSGDSLSGKVIFVTSVDEEESPYQYHSTVGTFTASRLPNQ